eukprot:Nk52_evm2s2542 gene=Nk52_evmTU2s2542
MRNLCLHLAMLVLACCVSTTFATSDKKIVYGMGGTGPMGVFSRWFAAFESINTDTVMNYNGTGSGGGIRGIKGENATSRPSYAYTGSLLLESDYNDVPDLQLLPGLAGCVAIAFSKDLSSEPLTLTMGIVSKIFSGRITKWNDPEIVMYNQGVTLPDKTIVPFVRSKKSGTIEAFTHALSVMDPWWGANVGISNLPSWPVAWNTSDSNSGVALQLMRDPYAIGVVELGIVQDLAEFIQPAKIVNRLGFAVEPSISATQEAIDFYADKFDEKTFTVSLTNANAEKAYPIARYTYWLIRTSAESNQDCFKTWLMVQYIKWTLTSAANAIAGELGWVSQTEKVIQKMEEKLTEVQCTQADGQVAQVVSINPRLQMDYTELSDPWAIAVTAFSGVVMLVFLFTLALIWYFKKHPVVKAASYLFLVLILGGLLMGSITVFLWVSKPTDSICAAQPWVAGLAFSLVYSNLLAKTFRIWRIFDNQQLRKRHITDKELLCFSGILMGMEVIILILMSILDRPYAGIEYDSQKADQAYLVCKSDMPIFLYIQYVYCGTIMIVGSVLAFKTRRIDIRFRESKYIGFCIYNIMFSGIVIIPIISTVDENGFVKAIFRVIVSLFVVITTFAALFIPKLMYMGVLPGGGNIDSYGETQKSMLRNTGMSTYGNTKGTSGNNWTASTISDPFGEIERLKRIIQELTEGNTPGGYLSRKSEISNSSDDNYKEMFDAIQEVASERSSPIPGTETVGKNIGHSPYGTLALKNSISKDDVKYNHYENVTDNDTNLKSEESEDIKIPPADGRGDEDLNKKCEEDEEDSTVIKPESIEVHVDTEEVPPE